MNWKATLRSIDKRAGRIEATIDLVDESGAFETFTEAVESPEQIESFMTTKISDLTARDTTYDELQKMVEESPSIEKSADFVKAAAAVDTIK